MCMFSWSCLDPLCLALKYGVSLELGRSWETTSSSNKGKTESRRTERGEVMDKKERQGLKQERRARLQRMAKGRRKKKIQDVRVIGLCCSDCGDLHGWRLHNPSGQHGQWSTNLKANNTLRVLGMGRPRWDDFSILDLFCYWPKSSCWN